MKKPKITPPIKSPFPQEMWLPLSRAKPYPKNPRVISETAIAKVAASIREYGPTQPIVLDEADEILIGHTRRLAALREGLETFPMLILAGLSAERKRALRIADNRTGEEAEWDLPLLKAELADLGDSFSGFDPGDLTRLFGPPDSANNAASEWSGMPEFEHVDKTAHRSLAVHFKDDAAVKKFAKLVGQKITDRTRFLWFPEIEIETYADKQYRKRP